jgi:hypothetical protein
LCSPRRGATGFDVDAIERPYRFPGLMCLEVAAVMAEIDVELAFRHLDGKQYTVGLQADLLSRIAIYDPMSGSVASRSTLMPIK